MKMKIFKNAHTNNFIYSNPEEYKSDMKHVSKISTGAIYESNGNRINSSVRIGGTYGDKVLDASSSFYKLNHYNKMIHGRSIYLGAFFGHYGHFITEGLSRMWLLHHENFDNVIFSPFIFNNNLSGFHKEFFKVFGINNIHILSETTEFEELWIPEQLWYINTQPHMDGSRYIYDFIKRYYQKNILNNKNFNDGGGKYLLSDKNSNSRVKNKLEIENIFLDNNFKIIYPEDLSFEEQIFYYLNAKILISFSGTLSHNVLFCDENKVFMFEIGDMRSGNEPIKMQKYIYEMYKINYKFIQYKGDEVGNISLEYIQNLILKDIK